MSTWDDKPNDYDHACKIIETLRAALELALENIANKKVPRQNIADPIRSTLRAFAKEDRAQREPRHEFEDMCPPVNEERE